MQAAFVKTSVWAVRDTESKQRLSYRYRSRSDAADCLSYIARTSGKSDNLEIYRTTQALPRASKPRHA